MILVTGATGTIGRTVLTLLAERDVPVRAMSRTPERIPAGFDTVKADFEDADSLRRAVDGVDTVFLLSAPGPHIPRHDLALLDVAGDVNKVVKLSAMKTGEPGFEVTSGWHLPGERAIQDSDRDWVVVRPSAFASNSLAWLPQIQAGQPIPSPYGDGAIGVVDPRDVAAVAAEALISDEHNKQTYTLTGPEPLSVADQVARLTEVLGKSLSSVDVPADAVRAGMLAQGMDSAGVDLALKGFEIVRTGSAAFVTDDVARVLGRAPGTFQDWVADHRELFS
ncbi:MAG: NAD(P)H-binding protein [Kibdelosporangium sp.]